jgi:competence protein ComEA
MQIGAPEWRAFEPPALGPDGEERSGPTPLGAWPPGPGLVGLVGLVAAIGFAVLGIMLLAVSASMPTGGDVVVGGEPLAVAQVPLAAADPGAAAASGAWAGIVVDVEGAVPRPGIQQLRRGDRVGDAIRAAGGFGPTADLSAAAAMLNLAELLADGQKVLVPARGQGAQAATAPSVATTTSGGAARIDLNRASSAELESLPGIGPVTAAKIIDARARAPFRTVEELRSRGLVGESVFGRVRDLVSASP